MSVQDSASITVQDGHEFVSTIAVSEEDAEGLLAVDTLLHRAAGWRVAEGQNVVVARQATSFAS